MPIYEYVCQACGHEFELFQKISDAPVIKCQECGQDKLQKIVSSTSFQLKGTGWYVTDFRDKGKKDIPATTSDKSKQSDKTNKETDTKAKTAETSKTETSEG